MHLYNIMKIGNKNMKIYKKVYVKEYNNWKMNQKIWKKIEKLIKCIQMNKLINIQNNYNQ